MHTKRLFWVDTLRVIAILMVVTIHSLNTSSLTKISFMGVPLFIMISGYLLLRKEESIKEFYIKRCKKVLIPWIFWTFLYMIYYLSFHSNQILFTYFPNNNFSLINFLRFIFYSFMSDLWFLPMIFGLYIITPLFKKLIKNSKVTYVYILLWLIVSFILVSHWSPNFIVTVFQYSGYFLIGYVLIKKDLLRRFSILTLATLDTLLLTIIVISSPFWYVSPIIVLSSTLFFYTFYRLLKRDIWKKQNRIKILISRLAKASFGIFLVNEMIADYVKYSPGFLNLLIVLFISVIVVLALQKIPNMGKIVPE